MRITWLTTCCVKVISVPKDKLKMPNVLLIITKRDKAIGFTIAIHIIVFTIRFCPVLIII